MSAFADEQREVGEPEQPELENPQVRISVLSGMDVFEWIAAVVGAVLFIASLIRTIRANPDTRIPFNRNPPVIPAGSIAMRSIGAGLLVFGGVALTNAHRTSGTGHESQLIGQVSRPMPMARVRTVPGGG